MKYTFLLVLILFFSSCTNKDLTCNDFHEGLFMVLADSIFPESYMVYKNGSTQKEWGDYGDTIYANIEYVNECNWILSYDLQQMELDEIEEMIQESGGTRLEIKEIKGDTLFYAMILMNDTLKYIQPGKMLKLK